MSHSYRLAVAAALLGSFVVGPAFAQGATVNIGCRDFQTLTPELQTEAVNTYIVETEGMAASEETTAEVVSMLLGKCNEFPDTQAITQLNEIPIEVQN
jgi:hypothetical protein